MSVKKKFKRTFSSKIHYVDSMHWNDGIWPFMPFVPCYSCSAPDFPWSDRLVPSQSQDVPHKSSPVSCLVWSVLNRIFSSLISVPTILSMFLILTLMIYYIFQKNICYKRTSCLLWTMSEKTYIKRKINAEVKINACWY